MQKQASYSHNASDNSKKSSADRCFNIQLCGNSSVGKTSIIHRLIYDSYLENTVVTLGVNYYKKSFSIQGEEVQVMIHDTSGQERYMEITKQSVRKADALILVYDKSNVQSFLELQSLWMQQFENIVDLESIPLLLIGNKLDVFNASNQNDGVNYDQADQFARCYNMSFFETSALSGQRIFQAFETLIQKLYLIKKNSESQRSRSSSSNKLQPLSNMNHSNSHRSKKCC